MLRELLTHSSLCFEFVELTLIIALAIGSPLRVAAFTGIVGKLFVSAFLRVKVRKPDVACYW